MSRIVVFGAGGRTGRAAVSAAIEREHQVTAVVRDIAKFRAAVGRDDSMRDAVHLVVGDVTDPRSVEAVSADHDAAISAVYDPATAPAVFFPSAAQAMLHGLPRAGVDRLIVVGLASVLTTPGGAALMDTPGYPQDYRSFYLAHAAGAQVLTDADTDLDWLIMSPAGDFDHGAGLTGRYQIAAAAAESRISYADFGVAMLDEIDAPGHHRTHLGIAAATS